MLKKSVCGIIIAMLKNVAEFQHLPFVTKFSNMSFHRFVVANFLKAAKLEMIKFDLEWAL